MSVVDSLKNIFAKKRADSDDTAPAGLSLGPDMPDPNITGSIEAGSTQDAANPDSEDDSLAALDAVDEAELIAVPLLGRRSIVTHQRILFTLLAMALVVLGSVAELPALLGLVSPATRA